MKHASFKRVRELGHLHITILIWAPVQRMAAHFEMARGQREARLTHRQSKKNNFKKMFGAVIGREGMA